MKNKTQNLGKSLIFSKIIYLLREKMILSKYEIDKKMDQFFKEMDLKRSSSILKKSEEEKRADYVEKIRKQKELLRLKKEQELKLKQKD